MDTMGGKSELVLELSQTLEMLAGQAVSAAAKENARMLRPSRDAGEVRRRVAETDAARAVIGLHGSPDFSGIRDIAAAVKRAEIGGMLNMRELLDISSLLKTARIVREYEGDGGCIAHLFGALSANKRLEERITSAILSEEEMSDHASSELSSIRRRIRASGSKVRETLQKYITSPNYTKYLQDPIITIRSDRYVLPVKSEFRGEINGLVHDVSSSGATFFIEPMSVVQLNNELRELAALENKEIERILAEFSAEVAAAAEEIYENHRALVALDLIFAKGKLSYKMNAAPPEIGDGDIYLKNARHPLLDPKSAVPITVRLGGEYDTLVVTGPNTGGKTVALKTIGLLTLMTAAGLHIPVEHGSRVSVFQNVFADIGDEQSIEQSLSTFSSHMTNIVKILESADGSALILFDELGAGTDPVEGAALAMAIIQYARERGAKIVATTHYPELKIFAMRTPGVENASCEFDVETLRPTYRLLIGIPGRSNAFAISKRLGLSEEIIECAEGFISPEDKRFEDVLSQLEEKRKALERERQLAEKLRIQAEADADQASRHAAVTERERAGAAERARSEARRIIADVRAEADKILEELRDTARHAAKDEDFRQINEARSALRRRLNEAEKAVGGGIEIEERKPGRPPKPGDTVRLPGTSALAEVLTAPDKDGNVALQAGIMKVTAKASGLQIVEDGGAKPSGGVVSVIGGGQNAPPASTEVDLRGMSAEEASGVLDMFMDNAFRAKLKTVSIIHGKGTGVLRSAVHVNLRRNKQIKSFRLGRYGEGESGVTIVEFQ